MAKQIRKVKLQPKTRKLTWGNQKIVPELRINGKWLADHGFKPGDHVEITVKKQELTIKTL